MVEHDGIQVEQIVQTITSTNAETVDILDINDASRFEIKFIRVSYDNNGSDTVLELYDEPAGTGSGNVSDQWEEFRLQGGDKELIEAPTYEIIENDIVANLDGSQDQNITIVIGGFITTV